MQARAIGHFFEFWTILAWDSRCGWPGCRVSIFCCFVSYAWLKDEQCLFVTRGRMTRGVDIFKWKGIFFLFMYLMEGFGAN